MVAYKFNLAQLADLENDFTGSVRAMPTIVQAVMRKVFREARAELSPGIPRKTGKLARSFGYSVRKQRTSVMGTFGFLMNRKISASTTVAGNVLQKGFAQPRKRSAVWVPLRPGLTTDDYRSMQNVFIQQSRQGNRIAFQRLSDGAIIPLFVLKHIVKAGGPPLPIDARGQTAAEDITQQIPETIAEVIVARRTAISSLAG